VGGLIQAYSECAKQTILNAKIENLEITKKMKIVCDYNEL
jgi:putative IMPACT (imprinted ancient) family translation regulator